MNWKAGRSRTLCAAVEIAARAYAIEPEAILRRSNERQPVAARRYVAKQLRQHGYSLPQIGRALGLHHSTVHYYLQGRPPSKEGLTGIDESGIWAI